MIMMMIMIIIMMIMRMIMTQVITLGLSLVAANTYGGPLLGMDEFPDWANETVEAGYL